MSDYSYEVANELSKIDSVHQIDTVVFLGFIYFLYKSSTYRMYFAYNQQGKDFGPFSADELRRMIAEGRFAPDKLIKPIAGGNWFPASDVFDNLAADAGRTNRSQAEKADYLYSRYYVRAPDAKNAMQLLGVSELIQLVREGTLPLSWQAIASKGQSAYTLKRSNEWLPISSLFPQLHPQTSGTSQDSRFQDYGRCNDPPTFVILECVLCQTRIRINAEFENGQVFRCKNCDARYSIRMAESDGFAVLIVPLVRNDASYSTAKRRPDHVVAALRVLDLPADSEWNIIRPKYRQMIAQYHPDKVNHLGEELRKLAAQKTKEYNGAFEILEGFFN